MSDRTEYLLSKLRSASLHTRLMANEIDGIGVALKSGFISDELAVRWAVDIGGPNVFGTIPPVIEGEIAKLGAAE